MLDLMPKKLIKYHKIKNWETYADKLIEYPFVTKYLKKTMKDWVDRWTNPLINGWIRDLFRSRLGYLEKYLKEMEKEVGEKNLHLFLNELDEDKGNPEDLYRKRLATMGEVFTFSQLKKMGYKNIQKISKFGDLKCDGSTISIKTILDLDKNYQIIEEYLQGLILIEENQPLRQFNYIELCNEKNIDYQFQGLIIDFLNNHLINILEFVIKTKTSRTGNIELLPSITQNSAQFKNHLNYSIYYYGDNVKDNIIVDLSEERKYAGELQEHKLKIVFQDYHNESKDSFNIEYGTDSFTEGIELEDSFLKTKIFEKIIDFNKGYSGLHSGERLMGWINFIIHPKHEQFIINNREKIYSFLKAINWRINYKITICLIPQWGSEICEPIVFEI